MTEHTNAPLTVALSSGKGGVGKTTLSVNLGMTLACMGRRVLVVDGDLGLANVDILLDIDVEANIRDVLDEGADPMSVVVEVEEGFSILPASSGVVEMVQLGADEQEAFEEVLRNLGKDFDLVLVDTAAGIGRDVLWFNTFVDQNVVVLTPDPTAVTDAYALMKVLRQEHDRGPFFCVVNNANTTEEGERIARGITEVAERFLEVEVNVLGVVQSDDHVRAALRDKTPCVKKSPDCPMARELQVIAEALLERCSVAG